MAQGIKGFFFFAAKPDDLSSIPRTDVVKEENQLPQVVLKIPHSTHAMHAHTQR